MNANIKSKSTTPLAGGVTSSERYLAQLGMRSFLSLWSYSNLFTDEGRRNDKGDGKELADLLVVFDRHVLIFSDKHCEFPTHADLSVCWRRWYRRAVEKSARQVLGARNWLMRFPDRIFLENSCQTRFPLPIPSESDIKFHLIAVTRGAYDACEKYFGGQGTGSLVINTALRGTEQHIHPFMIGHVFADGAFVHVLDELTMEVLLRELDTITDFAEYLEKKELLLSNRSRTVMASGEEQLITMYLTNVSDTGYHDFPDIPDNVNHVCIDEGSWEDYIQNPQYLAKKNADAESYAWDRLIEHLIQNGKTKPENGEIIGRAELEPVLRVLAAERRLARRQLSHKLIEAMRWPVAPGQRFVRLSYTKTSPDVAYVFLILPRPQFIQTYEEYREARSRLLHACCMVAKLRAVSATQIIGIATEPYGSHGASEDLLLLDTGATVWGEEQIDEAIRIQKETGILEDENVKAYAQRDDEYPTIATRVLPSSQTKPISPAKRLLERQRQLNREKMRDKGR